VVVVAARSHPPASSVRATVAMVSPDAMPGRYRSWSSSDPTFMSALAASATVEKYGAHRRAAPISSKTT